LHQLVIKQLLLGFFRGQINPPAISKGRFDLKPTTQLSGLS